MCMYHIMCTSAITIRLKLSLLIAEFHDRPARSSVAGASGAKKRQVYRVGVERNGDTLSFRAMRFRGETLAVGVSNRLGFVQAIPGTASPSHWRSSKNGEVSHSVRLLNVSGDRTSFRTRNNLAKVQRTRTESNESAVKSTKLVDILPLITVWLQVRVLPGPPSCFALRASQDCIHHSERSRMPSEALAKEGLTRSRII